MRRIAVYILIFVLSYAVLLLFIDSKCLFNLEKIMLMNRNDIKLESFQKIRKTMIPDNLIASELIISKDTPILIVPGFKNMIIKPDNKSILKRGALHPTQQLTLFSMAFATDYLISKTKNAKLSATDIQTLNKVYSFVYSEISNPTSLNSMTVNDHVISERIQFIMLYLSYLQEYEPDQKEMISDLNSDLNICTGFLLNNTHFTWQSNHGIMQLRAIAQLAEYTENANLRSELIETFNRRLLDIIPFFIGDDGAIYESATGYWIFIYSQFDKMSTINAVRELPSVKLLKGKISASGEFLKGVTTNDKYVQGLGDSYSKFTDNIWTDSNIPQNRFFSYSNQIAGFNWTIDSINSSILFVSLNTPPNVHKQPDDLSLYIYRNGSFFANTGIYSYKESKERTFFQNEKSQSTVIFENSQNIKPKGSYIIDAGINSNKSRILEGVKYYENQDTIYRKFVFENSNSFKIIDNSNRKKSLKTSFNVVRSVAVQQLSDTSILLENTSGFKMLICASQPILITKSYISDSYNHLLAVKKLEICGKTVVLKLIFLDLTSKTIWANQFTEIKNSPECKRYETAKVLNHKYKSNGNSRFNNMEFIVKSVTLLLFSLILIVFLFELICKKYVKIKI